MPYHLSDDGLSVLGEDGKPVPGGVHKNKRQALAHLQALEANVPEAGGKSLNLSYAKSLGLTTLPDLAVKSIGTDTITGYLALWGSATKADIEADYFTPDTDFWNDRLGFPRPLTWEHGQDPQFKGRVIVGQIETLQPDEFGLVYEATLDRAQKYRKMIDRLIDERALGTSSDSAPQYVQREQRGKAAWISQWPLFAGALTATPAEPRMLESVHFKSLGLSLPGWAEAPDGAQFIEMLNKRLALLKLYS